MVVRRRKCPTCWYSWLDKYNKPICPKCQAPMPKTRSGGGSRDHIGGRTIHTDRAVRSNRVGDIRRDRPTTATTVISTRRRGVEVETTGLCPKTGRKHMWRFGKCRYCGKAEGYARHSAEKIKTRSFPTASSERRRRLSDHGQEMLRRAHESCTTASSRGHRPCIAASSPSTFSSASRRRPDSSRKAKVSRRTCPTCAYRWLDKYEKNQCPKCLSPMYSH